MKKKTDCKINENGSFMKEETILTTPEDGFVSEKERKPAAMSSETRGKYHQGHSKTKVYMTNDPRITRPFVFVICGIFLAIGILTFVLHMWFFAAVCIGTAIFSFVKANKDIDAIAKKMKEQKKSVDAPKTH